MDENSQEYFFRTLFKVFNAADFKYVILHSWQTLPEITTSDVDMMIAADEKDRLEEVLTRVVRLSGWRFVQKLWYDVPCRIFISKNAFDATLGQFIRKLRFSSQMPQQSVVLPMV